MIEYGDFIKFIAGLALASISLLVFIQSLFESWLQKINKREDLSEMINYQELKAYARDQLHEYESLILNRRRLNSNLQKHEGIHRIRGVCVEEVIEDCNDDDAEELPRVM